MFEAGTGILALGPIGSGLVLASFVTVRRFAEFVVAVYVIAFAEIVGLVLLLSAFAELTRAALLIGSLALLAAALGVKLLTGGELAPTPEFPEVRVLLDSRAVLVLSGVLAIAFAYALALILGTPPNGWDQLNYHLARAALWLEEGVGYIGAAYDERLNIYPPNGEIPFSYLLGTTGAETTAALAQFGATLACMAAVFALSRRFGLDVHEAAFGALLFASLPIVVLQSTTTKNDLIVASLLLSATVLLLGDSRSAVAVGSLACALAVGAKFTAGYGVVVLVVLAIVAPPRDLRVSRLVGIASATLLGSYWYLVNAFEGGGLLGDRPSIPGLTSLAHPRENLVTLVGDLVDWLDLSGSDGADLLLYALVALAVTSALALTGQPRRTSILAGALVALPLLIWVAATQVGRPALMAVSDVLDSPQAYLAEGTDAASPTVASDTGSWFGPVGLLLVSSTGVGAVILARRGSIPRTALVAGLSPCAWLILVSLTLTYHPWQGRFFIFPVALSASLWGVVLRRPAFAWAAVALSATTVLLTMAHYVEKPSGLRLLDSTQATSVWQLDRSEIQSQHDPALEPVLRFMDEHVPEDGSIGLALGANDFGYPAFGPHLERTVRLVPVGSPATDIRTDWLYANPERAEGIDPMCWRTAFRSAAGTVFQRIRCAN